MKRFSNFFSFVILLFFCGIFVACDLRAKHTEYQGKIINEYPDWCCLYSNYPIERVKTESGQYPAFGYSEWIDWQSDEGKLLHNLVDDEMIGDDYSGKYRVEVLGQLVKVCFNDTNSSCVEFFTYIGDYDDYYKDRIIDIDTSSDSIEYDCWLLKGTGRVKFVDKCQDSNKSKVQMTKISDKKYAYKLAINEKNVINVDLKNISDALIPATLPKSLDEYSWFPAIFSEVSGDDYWKNGYYGEGWIVFHGDNNKVSLSIAQMIPLYCFEGLSFRSVDEENKKISFWLADRDKSNFADYFEIHIIKEDWNDEPQRGATDKNKSLMKGTLGFYKEGNPTPVRFFDEEHSEFTKNVD